jgi:hypothetical protein
VFAVPVNLPPSSITTICNSSLLPPAASTKSEVPGAPVNTPS